jgi:hypothetical protein
MSGFGLRWRRATYRKTLELQAAAKTWGAKLRPPLQATGMESHPSSPEQKYTQGWERYWLTSRTPTLKFL